jgi:hypothetical protein
MIAKNKVTESAEDCYFSDHEDYDEDDEYQNENRSVWQNYTDCVDVLLDPNSKDIDDLKDDSSDTDDLEDDIPE